jgi:hypothetical protein
MTEFFLFIEFDFKENVWPYGVSPIDEKFESHNTTSGILLKY